MRESELRDVVSSLPAELDRASSAASSLSRTDSRSSTLQGISNVTGNDVSITQKVKENTVTFCSTNRTLSINLELNTMVPVVRGAEDGPAQEGDDEFEMKTRRFEFSVPFAYFVVPAVVFLGTFIGIFIWLIAEVAANDSCPAAISNTTTTTAPLWTVGTTPSGTPCPYDEDHCCPLGYDNCYGHARCTVPKNGGTICTCDNAYGLFLDKATGLCQSVCKAKPGICGLHGSCDIPEQFYEEPGYRCICLPDFAGAHCETLRGYCEGSSGLTTGSPASPAVPAVASSARNGNPCLAGGTCRSDPKDVNRYSCACRPPTFGYVCQNSTA